MDFGVRLFLILIGFLLAGCTSLNEGFVEKYIWVTVDNEYLERASTEDLCKLASSMSLGTKEEKSKINIEVYARPGEQYCYSKINGKPWVDKHRKYYNEHYKSDPFKGISRLLDNKLDKRAYTFYKDNFLNLEASKDIGWASLKDEIKDGIIKNSGRFLSGGLNNELKNEAVRIKKEKLRIKKIFWIKNNIINVDDYFELIEVNFDARIISSLDVIKDKLKFSKDSFDNNEWPDRVNLYKSLKKEQGKVVALKGFYFDDDSDVFYTYLQEMQSHLDYFEGFSFDYIKNKICRGEYLSADLLYAAKLVRQKSLYEYSDCYSKTPDLIRFVSDLEKLSDEFDDENAWFTRFVIKDIGLKQPLTSLNNAVYFIDKSKLDNGELLKKFIDQKIRSMPIHEVSSGTYGELIGTCSVFLGALESNRDIISQDVLLGEYISNYYSIPNPKYSQLKLEYQREYREYQVMVSETQYAVRKLQNSNTGNAMLDLGLSLASERRGGEKINAGMKRLENLEIQIANTSATIEKPFYKEYSYFKNEILITAKQDGVVICPFNNQALKYVGIQKEVKSKVHEIDGYRGDENSFSNPSGGSSLDSIPGSLSGFKVSGNIYTLNKDIFLDFLNDYR